jgi:hypothetical protein
MRIRIMGIDQTYDYPVFACGPDWIEAVEHAASNIGSLVPDLIDQVGGGVLGPEVVTTVPDTRMIRHVTTFTPANGSPPRDIELWIGDTHKDPEGEAWTSHIQVYGLGDTVDVRVPGEDWASAVQAGARELRKIVHDGPTVGCLPQGGTMDTDTTTTEAIETRRTHGYAGRASMRTCWRRAVDRRRYPDASPVPRCLRPQSLAP